MATWYAENLCSQDTVSITIEESEDSAWFAGLLSIKMGQKTLSWRKHRKFLRQTDFTSLFTLILDSWTQTTPGFQRGRRFKMEMWSQCYQNQNDHHPWCGVTKGYLWAVCLHFCTGPISTNVHIGQLTLSCLVCEYVKTTVSETDEL